MTNKVVGECVCNDTSGQITHTFIDEPSNILLLFLLFILNHLYENITINIIFLASSGPGGEECTGAPIEKCKQKW
jgi:hypothetical protein